MKHLVNTSKACQKNCQQIATGKKGGFCKKCNDIVSDITTLTDSTLIHNKKKVCEKYHKIMLSDREANNMECQ